jgi:hypothetical protein
MTDTADTDGLEKMVLQDLQRDYKKLVKLRLTVLGGYRSEPKIALTTPRVGDFNLSVIFWINDECIWMAKTDRYERWRDILKIATKAVDLARPNYKEIFKRKFLRTFWAALAKEKIQLEFKAKHSVDGFTFLDRYTRIKVDDVRKKIIPLERICAVLEPEMDKHDMEVLERRAKRELLRR